MAESTSSDPTGATGATGASGAAGEPPGAPTRGYGFGTGPVFLASFSTILGAILFLRFGYAVGHTGLLGAFAIILIGHLVTIPTALAISEIATNRRVEGGGEYFIISRSFGQTIGGTIGILLFLSQSVSVAFYMAAFSQAFSPFEGWFTELIGFYDARFVSIPGTFLLALLVLTRGASLGVRALWIVTAVQVVAIAFFFLGGTPEGVTLDRVPLVSAIEAPHAFMLVFAICFPGFTGMTAGVGLSGDLKNPRRSIPTGIISATLIAMVVYIFLVIKLATSATPEMLAGNQLVMADIALWGPIILVGLACATLSSALGSIMVAPRTLQALGGDGFSPSPWFNGFTRSGIGAQNEPRNATLITASIAIVMVTLGSVDSIARVVSMFFMVTYGSLCAISVLEHFAARPSYRPSFKSKWYVSLLGAVMCGALMFLMDAVYATLAILLMVGLYLLIRRSHRGQADDGIAALFQGVMAQATRYLQIRLQGNRASDWRPSVIMISNRTFERATPRRFMYWLCKRYGFGTYIHYIQGYLNDDTYREGQDALRQLLANPVTQESNLYVDTMVSPSMLSALAQALQMPGVSGVENNTILFDFSVHDDPAVLEETIRCCRLAAATGINRLVLRHGDHFFGNRRTIHIWLTWHDYRNAGLMILIAYILLAHRDWENAEISIFAAYPESEAVARTEQLHEMIREGRIPIAPRNVDIVPTTDRSDFQQLVEERSAKADVTILGFTTARLDRLGEDLFRRHSGLREVLFVNAQQEIFID